MSGPSPSPSSVTQGGIIHLNVGGTRFTTSKQTLLWSSGSAPGDSFFTSLLSGRIASLKDESGSIFIDRDPKLFGVILQYLRTQSLALNEVDLKQLLHEAEFYGIASLIKQLSICLELDQSGCGDVLFYTYLAPPLIPAHERPKKSSLPPRVGGGAHSRNASQDLSRGGRSGGVLAPARPESHSRNSSADLSRVLGRPDPMGLVFGGPAWRDPLSVQIVKAHQNCICVAYPHFVACFKQRENHGFQPVFTSPYLEHLIERVAINAKVGSVLPAASSGNPVNTMIAIGFAHNVRLMGFTEDGSRVEIGTFNLHASVDQMFFIGTQLVALSPTGKIGVWNSMSQHWQSQELAPITSYDTAGSFLLLGSSNGSINYIDMQKFPLRMKDNDLLVTELYRDPAGDSVTAISVYLTPKTSISGNWIEIAYGTSSGIVRVIVQHPETVGHGPQLFQTFSVHRSPVMRVKLSEKFLVSLCSEYNHVRTWGVTRFRGMISTQPGSTSVSSFKILSLEEVDPSLSSVAGNDCGPFGEQDDEQIFVQKVVPETDSLFVRLASNGKRVCVIKSVDGTTITSFCVHECEGSSRIGARPRRFVITGHSSGAVQMWDLTTALDFFNKDNPTTHSEGGPTPEELVRLLDHLELSNSRTPTPCCISPSPSLLGMSNARVKAANVAFLNAQDLTCAQESNGS
eukprot:snap_masked-scaffold248_size238799-processed-gene-1.13 protein:Tk02161 transcript:snap_masked-scaffold248_size238799-processed-gene-1.13-mRNA-1 annotation:"btb poz domain-containing protein kctd3"